MTAGGGWNWARQARVAAIQMLYQWEVGRLTVPEVAESFWRIAAIDGDTPTARVRTRAEALVAGVSAAVPAIDPIIEQASRNWRLDRLSIVDRLVLRLAVYELLHERDTPPAVGIDEALELARHFSSEEAVSFVNGVLDAVAHRIERGELPLPPNPS